MLNGGDKVWCEGSNAGVKHTRHHDIKIKFESHSLKKVSDGRFRDDLNFCDQKHVWLNKLEVMADGICIAVEFADVCEGKKGRKIWEWMGINKFRWWY